MLYKAARTNCLADSCNHYNYNGEESAASHELTSYVLRMLILVDNCRDVLLPCDRWSPTRPIILFEYHRKKWNDTTGKMCVGLKIERFKRIARRIWRSFGPHVNFLWKSENIFFSFVLSSDPFSFEFNSKILNLTNTRKGLLRWVISLSQVRYTTQCNTKAE
jgi:hypothetical protein